MLQKVSIVGMNVTISQNALHKEKYVLNVIGQSLCYCLQKKICVKEATGSAAVIASTAKYSELMSLASVKQLPKLNVTFKRDRDSKPIKMNVIADTGAQACVAGWEHMQKLQFKGSLTTVGGSKLKVLGSHNIHIEHNGEKMDVEMYFIKGNTNIYLSVDVCKKMHIIPPSFPFTDARYVKHITSVATNSIHQKKKVSQSTVRP